ncbi:MAG TPA: FAD-dependent oxidoreductase [Arachnia sp.]|nr:FAD-dependent oxidoreductase [Arachnia sp.]HMT86676.1 FAD-dependent oxidoreductase [Arachnia sp.]
MSALVVGGGLAGLVAARRLLRRGVPVTLCEAAPRLGGMIAPATVGGVTVDAGAEAYATRTPAARDLCEELGLAVAPPAGTPHIWWEDGIAPMAEGILGIPADAGDPAVAALTAGERERLRRDLDLGPGPGADAVTIGELVEARMGRAAVDRLVGPVARGVYATLPERMPLSQFAPGLLDALRRHGSLMGAVAALRAPGAAAVEQPVGGMFRLIEALEQDVRARGGQIRLGAPVRAVRRIGDGFSVTAGDADHAADRLVIATEAAAAVALLEMLGVVVSAPPVHLARQALLAVRHPAAADGRVGSGLLLGASSDKVSAKAMTHYSAKWPWAADAGTQILRLSYSADVVPTPELALRDVSAFLGEPIPAAHLIGFEAVAWQAMPVRLSPAERARVGEMLRAAPGVVVAGAWLDGNGIGPVIAAVEEALA